MNTQLQRGDPCVFKWEGRYRQEAKVLAVYPEVRNGAVRVEWGDYEHIVRPDEVLSLDEYDRMRQLEIDKRNQEKYGDLIAAWKTGKLSQQELAEAAGTSILGIASRIRAAKRRNLLK